jgi:hypothetical protein
MRWGLCALFVASLAAAGCDKSGAGKAKAPDGQTAAIESKEEGERLEKIRAALKYRRGAEQRGKLVWQEDEAGRNAAMVGMYLQGSEDLGELSFTHKGGSKVAGSISILARGSGAGTKCKVEFLAAGDAIPMRTSFERNASAPEGLRVEVDRMNFDMDLKTLERLGSTPDASGAACGLSFSLTRSQRDRIDRVASLFGGDVDDAAMSAAQASWDTDRLPADGGGFRELGAELGPKE